MNINSIKRTLVKNHAVILTAKHVSTRTSLRDALLKELDQARMTSSQLSPAKGSIGIDAIRQLYSQTSYRQREQQASLVVINEAQTMTLPAQNAFLKLLEEPPRGVKFLLICPQAQSLLPTIRSRCQLFQYLPLSEADFKKKFLSLNAQERTRLYFASGGDPIEAEEMLKLEENQSWQTLVKRPLKEAVIEVSQLASSREAALAAVEWLTSLAHAGVRYAYEDLSKQKWLRRLEAGIDAKEQLASQANSKLVLDQLVLEFHT